MILLLVSSSSLFCHKRALSHEVRDHPAIMITKREDRPRSRLNKTPLSRTHNRYQVCLLLWKILVHEIVFCVIFKPQPSYAYFLHKGRHLFFLIKLAVRLCVRQIATEPIICHSYHPECSHEDINRKKSHFTCKEKGRRRSPKIPKAQIHTCRGEEWGEQQRRDEEREEILTARTGTADGATAETSLPRLNKRFWRAWKHCSRSIHARKSHHRPWCR